MKSSSALFLQVAIVLIGIGALALMLWEEARRVWELYRGGHVREIWFTLTDRRAVLLLECASEAEAIGLLSTLPLVREQCIAFEVLALTPYSGFERLFS